MKNTAKKIVSFVLTLFLLASLSALCAVHAADAEQPTLLLLGDSIAAGFGILNPDEACYGRIVADTNHYQYRNLAVMGTDSAELVESMKTGVAHDAETGDEVAWTDCIREAEIICLSVGANDFFERSDFGQILSEAMTGKGELLDQTAARYYENLCTILDSIASLNPDAAVIVQTYYCSCRGVAEKINLAVTDRVNAAIEQFDREHPGRIHICDISPAMTGKPANLADDCLHPNAKGNVAIAEILLKTLCDLGLGSETTPVVNVPGEDWSYYFRVSDNRFEAFRTTAFMMLATGNGVNILRLIRKLILRKGI